MPTEFKTSATNINVGSPMVPTTVAMNTGDGLEDFDGSTARDGMTIGIEAGQMSAPAWYIGTVPSIGAISGIVR